MNDKSVNEIKELNKELKKINNLDNENLNNKSDNNLDHNLRSLNSDLSDEFNYSNDKLCNSNEISNKEEIDRRLNKDEFSKLTNNTDLTDVSNKKCNQNCCALFAIYTERKLIKGQRFGPYLIESAKEDKLIFNSNDKSDLKEEDDLKDKENQFEQTDCNQSEHIQLIKEPAGFWLKVVRTTSSKPTAHIQIQGKRFFQITLFIFLKLRL